MRWQLTTPAILLLLTEGPSHGYELLRRLRPMFPRNAVSSNAGSFYRLLRDLEDAGSVRSRWAVTTGAGPVRRVYELTDSGRDTLDDWASLIECEIQTMSGLLATYYRSATEHHFPDSNR